MNVTDLLDTYQVDIAHARHVADRALELFDIFAESRSLPAVSRQWLELGALLHNVGLTTDPAQHHLVGRDIVLRQPLAELDSDDRALVATLIAFHRKKVRPQAEPTYVALGKNKQTLALQLAAIVRVADGLDYSQSQTTQIVASELTEQGLRLLLTGPQSEADGARAVSKADLWQRVFDEELQVSTSGSVSDSDTDDGDEDEGGSLLKPWYESSNVSLAELGLVLLRRHFRRLMLAERAIRDDQDPEGIHEMRVATRRMRVILQVMEGVAPAQSIRLYRRGLRRIARAAGAVRDTDVFIANIRAAADALPVEDAAGLGPLVESLQADRALAYEQLLDRLDSAAYATFKRDFASFITGHHDKWHSHVRVRDMAGSTVWAYYEALRSHVPEESIVTLADNADELHEMRIAGKRLRYLLEMFEDVFGERVQTVIEPLMAFQDHLGTINDTSVAAAYVSSLAVEESARPALDTYIAARYAERERLVAELPERWFKLNGGTYRRKLMELIVRL
jgi:CHAD domain-containing protein